MAKKWFVNKREWLNPSTHHDTGAMHTKMYTYSGGDIIASVSIWDCSRKINIDLDFDSKASKKQRVAKLKKMIKQLENLKTAMEDYEV